MKLRGKTSAIRFYAIDRQTGEWAIYDLRPHLKLHQLKRMGRDPFMIRDFARFIQRDYEQRGVPNVMVRAFVLCSMNGRKPQLMIDPDVDLTQDNLPPNWIVPLEADHRRHTGTGPWPNGKNWSCTIRFMPQLIASHPPAGPKQPAQSKANDTISKTDHENSPDWLMSDTVTT